MAQLMKIYMASKEKLVANADPEAKIDAVQSEPTANETGTTETGPEFPAIYTILGYFFVSKTREMIYQPSVEELKEDFARASVDATTPSLRRWLFIVFNSKAIILFLNSAWACIGGRVQHEFWNMLD